MWDGYNFTSDVARTRYGYDTASNPKRREDVVAKNNGYGYDEFYTYDGLQRLKTFDRGYLAGTLPNYTGISGTDSATRSLTSTLFRVSCYDVSECTLPYRPRFVALRRLLTDV